MTVSSTKSYENDFGGNGNYTYILKGLPSYCRMSEPQYPTRHKAVGAKAILEAIHLCDLELVVQERKATDPCNNENVLTSRELLARIRYGQS